MALVLGPPFHVLIARGPKSGPVNGLSFGPENCTFFGSVFGQNTGLGDRLLVVTWGWLDSSLFKDLNLDPDLCPKKLISWER